MSVAARKLGEMVVVGTIPARLVAPLEFLGNNLHSTLDDGKGRHAGWSRVACIATSLIVRDFLTALHIRADVRSVAAYAFATLNGTKYPERALGAPSDRIEPNQWQGHIVVVAEGVLIDTTLRGLDTPGVSSLPRMIALPIVTGGGTINGLGVIADLSVKAENVDLRLAWVDRPEHQGWRERPDALKIDRRRELTSMLLRSLNPKTNNLSAPYC